MDQSTYDQLQTILNKDGASSTPTIGLDTSAITAALFPFIILSTVITIVFVLLYVYSLVRKYKVESAIFESRNILREMNERQKATMPTQPEASAAGSAQPTEPSDA